MSTPTGGPMPDARREGMTERITAYLASGGLFNPEMANHDAVRDLLIECRDALAASQQEVEWLKDELAGERTNREIRERRIAKLREEITALRAQLAAAREDSKPDIVRHFSITCGRCGVQRPNPARSTDAERTHGETNG